MQEQSNTEGGKGSKANKQCIHSKIVQYILNQNWNQSDPDLYPETQRNILAMGLILNSKSDLYQFCSSVSVLQKQP